MVFLNNDKLLS